VDDAAVAAFSARSRAAAYIADSYYNSPPWFEPKLKRMEEFFVKILQSKLP